MPIRFVATLMLLLLSACGAPPGVLTQERVKTLQVELRSGDAWKCDRWAGGWGGDLSAGVLFGAWLMEHQVAVEIPSGETCASAAALAAMGATRLKKSTTGVLAFHGPTPALTPLQKVALKFLLNIWKVPEEMTERIIALEPGAFWIPRDEDLERLLASRREAPAILTAGR